MINLLAIEESNALSAEKDSEKKSVIVLGPVEYWHQKVQEMESKF